MNTEADDEHRPQIGPIGKDSAQADCSDCCEQREGDGGGHVRIHRLRIVDRLGGPRGDRRRCHDSTAWLEPTINMVHDAMIASVEVASTMNLLLAS